MHFPHYSSFYALQLVKLHDCINYRQDRLYNLNLPRPEQQNGHSEECPSHTSPEILTTGSIFRHTMGVTPKEPSRASLMELACLSPRANIAGNRERNIRHIIGHQQSIFLDKFGSSAHGICASLHVRWENEGHGKLITRNRQVVLNRVGCYDCFPDRPVEYHKTRWMKNAKD